MKCLICGNSKLYTETDITSDEGYDECNCVNCGNYSITRRAKRFFVDEKEASKGLVEKFNQFKEKFQKSHPVLVFDGDKVVIVHQPIES